MFGVVMKDNTDRYLENINNDFRNGIAHGEDITVEITIGTIITLYKSSIKIILYIDLIFKKNI